MNENEKEAENGKRHFFKFLIFKWQYQLKLNRFGKRSEVEAEAGGATNDDVIGAKGIQRLTSPFSMRLTSLPTDAQILRMLSKSRSITKRGVRNGF